jgi:hypothetical protein
MIGEFCFAVPHLTPAVNTGDETTMFVIWYVSRYPFQVACKVRQVKDDDNRDTS